MPKLDEFMQIAEAAEYLGVCQNTLRNWGRAGKIREYRHTITKNDELVDGINWLKTELPNFWDVLLNAIVQFDFFAKLDAVARMVRWKEDFASVRLFAGALRNEHG